MLEVTGCPIEKFDHIRVSNSYTKQEIGIIKFDVNEMGNYQGQQISFRASTECESSV